MVSKVLSASITGLSVEFVQVEADTSNGLPMFHMVGYLSSEVKEASDRVRSAIRNTGLIFPAKRVVVNLSPADVRKRGTAFDLPIAVAVLASVEVVRTEKLCETLLVGELGLDGSVKKVSGILPIVMEAKKKGVKTCIVPEDNQEEGKLVEGIQIIGVSRLLDVCAWLNGENPILKKSAKKKDRKELKTSYPNYRDMKGQKLLRRAVEVAVAGNHNLLMIGPPGVGKTMVAKRIPSILPPLTRNESMELTMLYSIAGELDDNEPLITRRPYREVHHSVTKAALLGGGVMPRPGEISLADHGVLFLDELAEFPKSMLELLRQPIENDEIKIIRQNQECRFPTRFLLVAAMNPCPCGNYPDLNRCTCTSAQIQAYRSKISQPLLDRFDICVEAERIPYEDLQEEICGESSEQIRTRVVATREIQRRRYHKTDIQTNAKMRTEDIKKYCRLGKEEENLMHQAFDKLHLTARSYHKILCVARTIADLDEAEEIEWKHLGEAIGYRMPDRMYWGLEKDGV